MLEKNSRWNIFNKTLEWKNSARNTAYELSVFDKTLVIDTDFVFPTNYLHVLNAIQEFMIAKIQSSEYKKIRTRF